VITSKGLLEPTIEEIYEPVMEELKKFNIKFDVIRVK
jgi:arabinogalactan endo-1,4-beta-galactosidase